MAKTYEVEIGQLIPDDKNFNRGTGEGREMIRRSLQEFGAGRSVLVDKDMRIIAGNKTHENADAANIKKVIVVETDGTELVAVKRTDVELDSREGREMALADNATAKVNLEWDVDAMTEVSEEYGIDLDDWGVDFMMDEPVEKQKHGKLTDKFVVPPFSVLDTRQGYWRERKKVWHDLINDNCESRGGALDSAPMMRSINDGASLLDPVMAEVLCKWFGVDGGSVFDCFAGDSVFGYVSAYLGLTFTGIELRKEQADLNNERVQGMTAKYICDDGQNVCNHIKPDSQDLLFSCPPYYDLEIYSDDPRDASNQGTYQEFLDILRTAFAGAIKCLKDERFACVVVGDIRDKNGFYRGFPDDIVRIFEDNGMRLYNELILIEPIGTLPQRVAKYMANRKVGKCHQNVLIFYKGDPSKIKNNFKEIQYASEDLERFEMDFGNEPDTAD